MVEKCQKEVITTQTSKEKIKKIVKEKEIINGKIINTKKEKIIEITNTKKF